MLAEMASGGGTPAVVARASGVGGHGRRNERRHCCHLFGPVWRLCFCKLQRAGLRLVWMWGAGWRRPSRRWSRRPRLSPRSRSRWRICRLRRRLLSRDVVNIWLFQIGLRGPSSLEEWRERLERVCDAPIWEAEPAARIATEFVLEDGGDPIQPGFLQEAVFALWTMARQSVVCGDRFPPDADYPPPVGYRGIAPDTTAADSP